MRSRSRARNLRFLSGTRCGVDWEFPYLKITIETGPNLYVTLLQKTRKRANHEL
jgi:hypothetical protein